jgi:hypothetical protein
MRMDPTHLDPLSYERDCCVIIVYELNSFNYRGTRKSNNNFTTKESNNNFTTKERKPEETARIYYRFQFQHQHQR